MACDPKRPKQKTKKRQNNQRNLRDDEQTSDSRTTITVALEYNYNYSSTTVALLLCRNSKTLVNVEFHRRNLLPCVGKPLPDELYSGLGRCMCPQCVHIYVITSK